MSTTDTSAAQTSETGSYPRPRFNTSLELLRSAQKTAKGAPAYTLYVNRPVGRVLAAGAHVLGLSPNHVTLISAVLTGAGLASVAVLTPSVAVSICVTVLLVIGYFLDSADGQLARLVGGGSRTGEWFDHVADCGKTVALHAAVLVGLFRFGDFRSEIWLMIPIVYQFAAVVTFFAGILAMKLKKGAVPGPAAGVASVRRSFIQLPADYGVLCLAFLLLWSGTAFLVAYGTLTIVNVAFMVAFLVHWHRELTLADASALRSE